MTTIRVARRDRFVTVQQSTVRDPKLSLRAVGLLVRLLSYPDNWRINSDEVARSTREGRDAVRRALHELEDAGYLSRTKCQVAGGRWTTELVLRETPVHADDGFSGVGAPTDDGFSGVGANRDDAAKAQVAPTTGKPTTGKPTAGKSGAIRKTVTNDCDGERSRDEYARAADPAISDELTTDDLAAIRNPRIRDMIAAGAGLIAEAPPPHHPTPPAIAAALNAEQIRRLGRARAKRRR